MQSGTGCGVVVNNISDNLKLKCLNSSIEADVNLVS